MEAVQPQKKSGNYLLSHKVSQAVPSALVSLTTLFGMGRGVSSPLSSPEIISVIINNDDAAVLISKICLEARDFIINGQVGRTISTARLNTLLHLHLRPINHVVFMGPDREILSWSGLPT